MKSGNAMNVTVQIPDDLAKRLAASGDDLSRRALEGFALEEYKAGHITKAELRRLLGLETRYELDGFLKVHGVIADVTIEDLRRDLGDLESLKL
jgi:hypothetical protein